MVLTLTLWWLVDVLLGNKLGRLRCNTNLSNGLLIVIYFRCCYISTRTGGYNGTGLVSGTTGTTGTGFVITNSGFGWKNRNEVGKNPVPVPASSKCNPVVA